MTSPEDNYALSIIKPYFYKSFILPLTEKVRPKNKNLYIFINKNNVLNVKDLLEKEKIDIDIRDLMYCIKDIHPKNPTNGQVLIKSIGYGIKITNNVNTAELKINKTITDKKQNFIKGLRIKSSDISDLEGYLDLLEPQTERRSGGKYYTNPDDATKKIHDIIIKYVKEQVLFWSLLLELEIYVCHLESVSD